MIYSIKYGKNVGAQLDLRSKIKQEGRSIKYNKMKEKLCDLGCFFVFQSLCIKVDLTVSVVKSFKM